MQGLGKILEEVKDALKDTYLDIANNYDVSDLRCDSDKVACVAGKFRSESGSRIEDIISKYMYDGWIPVEERLPEKNEYFVDTSSDREFPNGYYRRLEIAYMTDTIGYTHGYYDGYKWMDKWHDIIKNVVAWKIHEPYHPEKKMKGQISLEEYIVQRPKMEWGGCEECYRRFLAKQDRDAERRNG